MRLPTDPFECDVRAGDDVLMPPADWGDLAELFRAPPPADRPTGVLPPGPCPPAPDGLRLTDPVERLARLFAELDE